jgi:transcriptional regulator with XRE-family HTH domain
MVVDTQFAEFLKSTMEARKMNASDVARAVWGSVRDKRGYDVARNRDRIGHYLSGRSFPDKKNRARIAKAIGVKPEDIERLVPVPTVRGVEMEVKPRRGTAKFQYDILLTAYADAVQYRRDKQEELARAMAREHEMAERLMDAIRRLPK